MLPELEDANATPALRARILVEALPYIRNFRGKRVLIKYGGSAMLNQSLKRDFAEDIALLGFKIGRAHV